jgi:hypothetical protein
MNTRAQLWCAWAIVPFILIYLIGFIGVAGFVPPTAPSMASAQLVEFYNSNRIGIRGGQLICLIVSPLFLCWAAAVSAQIARVEKGALPMLSLLQFGAALILTVFFMLCSLIWSVAAYREDMSPELLRLVHDTGWLFFVMAYPEYLVQLGCIAVIPTLALLFHCLDRDRWDWRRVLNLCEVRSIRVEWVIRILDSGSIFPDLVARYTALFSGCDQATDVGKMI